METRPELILLQKTMVVVEGVARSLDPALNIWKVAEPVVREWIEDNLGPVGRIQGAMAGAGELGVVRRPAGHRGAGGGCARAVGDHDAGRIDALAGDNRGDRADQGRKSRWRTLALWIIAATFIGILLHSAAVIAMQCI